MTLTRFLSLVLIAGPCACAHPATAGNLSRSDSLSPASARACRASIAAASVDSQTIDVRLAVLAFDGERGLSRDYSELLATGIRQFLVLPTPLTLDTYDGNVAANAGRQNRFGALTLSAAYRATLHRNGHLIHARPTGGATTPDFDAAMLSALVALDTSGLLPRPPDGADWFMDDTAALVVRVSPRNLARPKGEIARDDTLPAVPLLKMRVAVEKLDHDVRRVSGPLARYPQRMLERGEEAKAMLQFVVDVDGKADVGTMHVLPPIPYWDFVNAALQSIARTRYEPMVIGGCRVRSIVQQPYVFGLTGR